MINFADFIFYLYVMKFSLVNGLISKGLELPIMDLFYTIQGEGYHKGSAAFFIRVGGCDVGCHWCDIKESWDFSKYPLRSIDEIVFEAKKYSKLAVITGGEPLMWNMEPITNKLKKISIRTHVETSGAYPVSGIWDWFCLSPKKSKLPTKEAYNRADELKIIIHNRDDLIFAEIQSKLVNKRCKLFLQPEWENKDKMTPKIVDYIMKNPKWKISLQTHKYIGVK